LHIGFPKHVGLNWVQSVS